MDHFNNVLTTFLGLGTFQLCCCLWRVRKLSDFIQQKNLNLCSEGLTGLKRHEGEKLKTEFSFLGKQTL